MRIVASNRSISVLFLSLLVNGLAVFAAETDIRIVCRPVAAKESSTTWQLSVLMRSETEIKNCRPIFKTGDRLSIDSVTPEAVDLSPGRWTLFHVAVSGVGEQAPDGEPLEIMLPDRPDTKTVCRLFWRIDLEERPWQIFHAGKDSRLNSVVLPSGNDIPWREIRLPKLWDELGVSWLRTTFTLSKDSSDRELRLLVSAIDDNDRTFINGREIGKTNGWDVLRNYVVPRDVLRYGEENELLIAVENVNAGGGIAAGPICLGIFGDVSESITKTSLFPKQDIQLEADRQTAREPGKPFPLRPMQVRDGVLEYEDGGEVMLWGVNYYPQSWQEFQYLKESGVDFKKTIDEDLDDLLRDRNPEGPNRINAIRIHVFDTEISDAEGNLVRNIHLDLLDYLVSKCNERGVCLWLTPIAWWSSPGARPDAFSLRVPMQAMTLCEETWSVQRNFLRQFLEHENPYTKRRLVDEPCLNLIEVINEPLYWSYAELLDLTSRPHGRTWPRDGVQENSEADPNVLYRKKIRKNWNAALPDSSWENRETWEYYCYDTVRRYVDAMIETIRQTGAEQPISYSTASFNTKPSVFEAVGDSRCDAVTLVLYPGGLQQKPQADARNLLPQTADAGLPSVLSRKARLVYEFDASDTLRQIDLYPAIARYFRNLGVQVACQFQYDSHVNASHNQAWSTHYLNARHAPERFVSFLIGGETFRTLPRGTQYKPKDPDRWIFPPSAVSYSVNAALLAKDGLYMQARNVDWKPFELPVVPRRIIAVGSTPYYDYEGTGIVDLTVEGKTVLIRIADDVTRLRQDTLRGTPDAPLTRLENGKHSLKMKIPAWQDAKVELQTDSGWKSVAENVGEYKFETGKTYRLELSPTVAP